MSHVMQSNGASPPHAPAGSRPRRRPSQSWSCGGMRVGPRRVVRLCPSQQSAKATAGAHRRHIHPLEGRGRGCSRCGVGCSRCGVGCSRCGVGVRCDDCEAGNAPGETGGKQQAGSSAMRMPAAARLALKRKLTAAARRRSPFAAARLLAAQDRSESCAWPQRQRVAFRLN